MSPIVLPHTFKIQKIGIFKFGIFLSYVWSLSYLSFNGNNMGIWNSIYSIMSFYRNLLSHSVVISQCVLKIPEEAFFIQRLWKIAEYVKMHCFIQILRIKSANWDMIVNSCTGKVIDRMVNCNVIGSCLLLFLCIFICTRLKYSWLLLLIAAIGIISLIRFSRSIH